MAHGTCRNDQVRWRLGIRGGGQQPAGLTIVEGRIEREGLAPRNRRRDGAHARGYSRARSCLRVEHEDRAPVREREALTHHVAPGLRARGPARPSSFAGGAGFAPTSGRQLALRLDDDDDARILHVGPPPLVPSGLVLVYMAGNTQAPPCGPISPYSSWLIGLSMSPLTRSAQSSATTLPVIHARGGRAGHVAQPGLVLARQAARDGTLLTLEVGPKQPPKSPGYTVLVTNTNLGVSRQFPSQPSSSTRLPSSH